jgi:hypothetical protein
MRYIQYCFIVICFIIFCSCGSYVFPCLEIINISIESNRLVVSFNSVPERNSLISAFTFSCDSFLLDGEFAFDQKDLLFYPIESIKDGHDYIVEISTEAEDVHGLSLFQKYIYKFSTKKEFSPPEIRSITPKNEEEVEGAVDKVTIEFSEPINEISFINSLSIKPSIDYFLYWKENNSCVDVKFIKPLLLATTYTVSIAADLCDLNNNFLLNEFVSSFYNGIDKTEPTYKIVEIYENDVGKELISGVINKELRLNTNMRIIFNEAINLSTVASRISIKPDMSIIIDIDNENPKQVDIKFLKTPVWNDVDYILTVASGISDLSLNEIKDNKEYNIRFDNESDRPISFIKALIEIDSDNYFSINESSNYTSLFLPVEKFPTTGGITSILPIYYIFRISNNATGIDFISAMENIFGISSTNSCISTAFISIDTLNENEIQASSFYNNNEVSEEMKKVYDAGGKLAGVKIEFEIENTDSTGQVEFSIAKDIKDSLGNSLSEDLAFKYNKQ